MLSRRKSSVISMVRPSGLRSRTASAGGDMRGQVEVTERRREDVHRNRNADADGLPFGGIVEGLGQHDVGHRPHQAALADKRQEMGRAEQPRFGWGHRTSASTPTTSPERRSNFGW